ncbi:MAG: tRNA (adenosine(37)-N6)-threonylcarbamoyltransferase complex ATPase subunit type 1 TsaE [Chloroflexi bacterium]|nr:tRNA (adenosine(37)-N6)-threonylcarbamoyltransferase complex ATPase subunit type 1 TsaE [Chloroflexota bacterium]MBV9132691.1 tRNA (adenosine(37)-N6)-threonylcarbamoyltransferase complex ATPase subunit type 1 TsaE [Chloroflexota bacterium]
MRNLGCALGAVAQPGDRFLLEGPFGAGKTTFVQGLAVGLGVTSPVGSPSFVIETQYRGRLTLYHVDLYRLDRIEPSLLEELEEHLFGDGVTAVEWAERLPPQVQEGATLLRFNVETETRRVHLSGEERFERAATDAL